MNIDSILFTYNYETIRKNMEMLKEELLAVFYHPYNRSYLSTLGL